MEPSATSSNSPVSSLFLALLVSACGSGTPPTVEFESPTDGETIVGLCSVPITLISRDDVGIELAAVIVDDEHLDEPVLGNITFADEGDFSRRKRRSRTEIAQEISATWTIGDPGEHRLEARVLDIDAEIGISKITVATAHTLLVTGVVPGTMTGYEVHLFDTNGTHLACAGAGSGLDAGGQMVKAYLQDAKAPANRLRHDRVATEPVEIALIRNLDAPCPQPPSATDHEIGRSAATMIGDGATVSVGGGAEVTLSAGCAP